MHDPAEEFRSAILAAIGAAPDSIEYGKRQRFSTNGKRGDLSGWYLLFDERGGVYGDWRQGISEVWTSLPQERMTPAERALLRKRIAEAKAEREREQREAWRRNRDRNEYTGRRSRLVVAGDPVHWYLRNRLAVECLEIPACLRYHPALPYVHEGVTVGNYPAMLAPVVDRSGAVLAWHRTYLTNDGRKASVPGPVKKLSPAAGLLSGCCIPLQEPKANAIGIAEGIETALAANLASGVPVVAAYSAGNLAAWKWPAVRRVVVFGDADRAGRKASEQLRARVTAAGIACEVLTPEVEGSDWCDVWAARTAEVAQ